MPTGLIIEINVYKGRVMSIMVRMPAVDSDCEAVAAEMINYISVSMRKEDPETLGLLEFFFTVTESLKCEFPGLASAVRKQVIKAIKEREDAKK